MNNRTRILQAALAGLTLCSTLASADVITFDGLQHGEIVSTPISGVTISANNVGGGPNLAIIFDSTRTGTADPDLEDGWSGGNLPLDTNLGNLLIIAENDIDANNDGLIDSPDDEGSRPAGTLTFDFDFAISSIGFDLIDIEGVVDEPGKVVSVTTGSGATGEVQFAALAGIHGVVFGDNSANRIMPLAASDFGLASGSTFRSVTFNFGGSGAVDNIAYTPVPVSPGAASVPAPAIPGMLLLAGGLLAMRRRAAAAQRGM